MMKQIVIYYHLIIVHIKKIIVQQKHVHIINIQQMLNVYNKIKIVQQMVKHVQKDYFVKMQL